MTPTPIRVVVCDDAPILRMLMRYALEEGGDIQVVGEAADALGGIDRVTELQPDVVLLDLSMPGLDGFQALPRVRTAAPDAAIIIFSAHAADRMSERALSLGADSYLEKGADLEVVRTTVRNAAATRHGAG